MLVLGTLGAGAQNYDRGYVAVPSSPFVTKGTWVVAGTFNYSQHVNDGHSILLINDINSTGYNISVDPKVLYMVKDNMGVGMKFSYDRSMLDLASANLSIADIEMGAKDCYQINHKYSAHALCRAYIPFGNIKRFSLFANERVSIKETCGLLFNHYIFFALCNVVLLCMQLQACQACRQCKQNCCNFLGVIHNNIESL